MDASLTLLHRIAAALAGIMMALASWLGAHVTVSTPMPQIVESPTSSQQGYTGYAEFPTGNSAEVGSSSLAKPASTPVATPSPIKTKPAVPTQPQQPTYSVEQLNQLARGSLVNILCTQSGGSFNPISGSGVIVDTRGVILTNAHVAQYLLLRNYPSKDSLQCVVRMGSPAQPLYTAELMYLPPEWVAANAQKIASSTPTGTGQNDYAFLYITGTTNPNGSLPRSFPALPMEAADADTGEQMVLAAYPAGFLGGISITINLYISSAVATVGQLYAFSGEHVDLFSLGGTVVSQSGSSGGAVVNPYGKLQGLIVTERTADTTAGRDLRALTIGHINRSLTDAGQGGILGLLSHDPAAYAAAFNSTIAPEESAALVKALGQ